MNDTFNIYRGRYKEFIESKLSERPSNEEFQDSVCHHIILRSLGGTWDDGYIHLTYAEHLRAHEILFEENPNIPEIIYAYYCMCTMKCGYKVNNDTYERLQKSYRELQSSRWSGEGNPKSKNPPYGELNPMYGKPSPNRGKKISRGHTLEGKKIISECISIRNTNRVWVNNGIEEKFLDTSELCNYLELGYIRGRLCKGKGNPGLKGIKYSEEFRDKARISSSRRDYPKVCARCGKHFLGGKSARYCPDC